MDTQTNTEHPSLEQLLASKNTVSWWKRIVYLLLVLLLSGGGLWWYLSAHDSSKIEYITATAVFGDLTVTVTATGVLQPVNQVDVGTEVSGTVRTIEADFNDKVTIGQVLAKLDTTQMEAKLRQSAAALKLADANAIMTTASLNEAQSRFERIKALRKEGSASQDDFDTVNFNLQRSKAALKVANAQVAQAQAQYDSDNRTLEKATIRSPINGIVLKRQIEPGQTVAASLQTPVLFTLAENLTQMELQLDVDEADIGKIANDQKAVFTVDAWANKQFPGTVLQVRFAPQTIAGVVTYQAILSVNNDNLSLRPGMTATATIIVEQKRNVLLIPNAALRFIPASMAIENQQNFGIFRFFIGRRNPDQSHSSQKESDTNAARVWVLKEGLPQPLTLTIGATDEQITEVLNGPVKAGTVVIVDTVSSDGP